MACRKMANRAAYGCYDMQFVVTFSLLAQKNRPAICGLRRGTKAGSRPGPLAGWRKFAFSRSA